MFSTLSHIGFSEIMIWSCNVFYSPFILNLLVLLTHCTTTQAFIVSKLLNSHTTGSKSIEYFRTHTLSYHKLSLYNITCFFRNTRLLIRWQFLSFYRLILISYTTQTLLLSWRSTPLFLPLLVYTVCQSEYVVCTCGICHFTILLGCLIVFGNSASWLQQLRCAHTVSIRSSCCRTHW